MNLSSGTEGEEEDYCEPLDFELDSDGWGDISAIPGKDYSPFHHGYSDNSESSSVSEGSERRRVKRVRVSRWGESGGRHSPSRQRVGRAGSGSRDGVGLPCRSTAEA